MPMELMTISALLLVILSVLLAGGVWIAFSLLACGWAAMLAGLSNVEAARVLGLAERTAKRTWAYVRAWLRKELTEAA